MKMYASLILQPLSSTHVSKVTSLGVFLHLQFKVSGNCPTEMILRRYLGDVWGTLICGQPISGSIFVFFPLVTSVFCIALQGICILMHPVTLECYPIRHVYPLIKEPQ